MAPPPLRLSLSGAGFLGTWHLGVADALLRFGAARAATIAGASAGALVGAVLTTDTPLSSARAVLRSLVATARDAPMGILTPGGSILEGVREQLDEHLPHDAHALASGRLHIALTSVRASDGWNPLSADRIRYVSEFGSRDELIHLLCASSDIPGITARLGGRSGARLRRDVRQRRGLLQRLLRRDDVDGGMIDLFPDPWRTPPGEPQPSPTWFVSPFAGVGFACAPPRAPGRSLSVPIGHGRWLDVSADNVRRWRHSLFPPRAELLDAYEAEGRDRAERFLKERGYSQK